MADSQQEAVAKRSIEVGKLTRTLKHKFVFDQCCFCVPLRTGSLILAYFFLVGHIVLGCFSSLVIATVAASRIHLGEDYYHELNNIVALNVVTLLLVLISVPFNIVLLFGLHKERRSLVKLYIMFQLAYLTISVILEIVRISLGHAFIVTYAIILTNLVFNVYYLLVLRSQYVKMGENANKLPGKLYRDGPAVDTSLI